MSGGVNEASHELIARWRQGDEQAANELFHRYASRLLALADSRLSGKLERRGNAEDVVQSAYRSFFAAARDGRYVLERSGDLWRLLVAITLHKVRKHAEYHTAAKRSINRERETDADAQWFGLPLEVLAQEPSPAEAAALTDEIQHVLQRLEPQQQRVLELRLQGYSVEEIATQCACSSRTVKRALAIIREELERLRGDA